MKRYLQYFILILIISVFTACSSSKKVKEVSLPSWYLNTPNSNSHMLYGSADSVSLDAAKKEALKNIAEGLIINLNSSFKSSTKTSYDGLNKTYLKENIKSIESKTKSIDFPNYKVQKAVNLSNRFYVLVSVSRAELFSLQKEKLDEKDRNISNIIETLKTKSTLEQIYTIKQLKNKINDAKENALVLNAIDNSFDFRTYHIKYDEVLNKEESLKDSIIISINSSNSDNLYKEHLTSFVNKYNYKVSENNPNVYITLKNNIRYSLARGWNIAKVTSIVNIKTNDKNLTAHTIDTIGRSSSSKENAKVSSANAFKNKIEQMGIDKILFGK